MPISINLLEKIRGRRKLKFRNLLFFYKVLKQFLDASIVAEDLGLITDEVRELMSRCEFPGMKIRVF